MNLLKKPYLLQGVYYLLTGIWPILHIESFMVVSGPKTDLWLVKTVGVLVGVIGLTFLYHSFTRRKETSGELILLGLASAIGFGFIDVYYASIDRIWEVYFIDAIGQLILIGLWIYFIFDNSHRTVKEEGEN